MPRGSPSSNESPGVNARAMCVFPDRGYYMFHVERYSGICVGEKKKKKAPNALTTDATKSTKKMRQILRITTLIRYFEEPHSSFFSPCSFRLYSSYLCIIFLPINDHPPTVGCLIAWEKKKWGSSWGWLHQYANGWFLPRTELFRLRGVHRLHWFRIGYLKE